MAKQSYQKNASGLPSGRAATNARSASTLLRNFCSHACEKKSVGVPMNPAVAGSAASRWHVDIVPIGGQFGFRAPVDALT